MPRHPYEHAELAVGEIAQARHEPEPEQVCEREHMVGRPARIRVVSGGLNAAAVRDQPVEHIRRLGRGRRD